MVIKILNKIDELPGFSRVEIDHIISIKRNEDIEELKEIEFDTLCGFKFDKDSFGCRTCDNCKYCQEHFSHTNSRRK